MGLLVIKIGKIRGEGTLPLKVIINSNKFSMQSFRQVDFFIKALMRYLIWNDKQITFQHNFEIQLSKNIVTSLHDRV